MNIICVLFMTDLMLTDNKLIKNYFVRQNNSGIKKRFHKLYSLYTIILTFKLPFWARMSFINQSIINPVRIKMMKRCKPSFLGCVVLCINIRGPNLINRFKEILDGLGSRIHEQAASKMVTHIQCDLHFHTSFKKKLNLKTLVFSVQISQEHTQCDLHFHTSIKKKLNQVS